MPTNSYSPVRAAIPEGEDKFFFYYYQRSRRIFELIRSSEFPDLTDTDGMILHAFNAHSHGNHGVQIRPSMTLVARETGVDRSTVKRSLKKLADDDHRLLEFVKQHATGVKEYRFGDVVLVAPNMKVTDQMWTKPRIRKRGTGQPAPRGNHCGAMSTEGTEHHDAACVTGSCHTVRPHAACAPVIEPDAHVDAPLEPVAEHPYPTDDEVRAFFSRTDSDEAVEGQMEPGHDAPAGCTQHPGGAQCTPRGAVCATEQIKEQITINGSKEQILTKTDSTESIEFGTSVKKPFETAGRAPAVSGNADVKVSVEERPHTSSDKAAEPEDDIRAFFEKALRSY